MAEPREPPPLFDDDDSRRDDDNEDLFSSAVQSPVNGQVTPEVTASQTTPAAALQPSNSSPTPPVSDTATFTSPSSDKNSLVPVHPFSDPLQLVGNPTPTSTATSDITTTTNSSSPFVDPALGSPDSLGGDLNAFNTSMSNTLEATSSDLNSYFAQTSSAEPSSSASAMLEPVDVASVDQAAVGESRQPLSIDNDGLLSEADPNPSLDLGHPSLTSTTIGNLPPVPSNMYIISSMAGVEDSSNSMDLFESCVEDAIVRPFSTVSLSAPQDVNTAGALGFEEPFSDAAFFGIASGHNQPTTPGVISVTFGDMAEPPALPDVAEPPALPDVAEPPALPDVTEPQAFPDMAELSAIPDITEPLAIPDITVDPFELDGIASDNKDGGDAEENLVIPDEADGLNKLSEDTADSTFVAEANSLSEDGNTLPPALSSQAIDETDGITSPGDPPAIEQPLIGFVPAPTVSEILTSADLTSDSETVQDEVSMFPKVNVQSLQKQQDTGFFLSEDETMEVPLDGLPAEPKIKTHTTEVSLDDDDDGLFSSGVLDTSSAQVKNSTAPSAVSAPSTLPPIGVPITPPVVSPSSGAPDPSQAPLYTTSTDANNITTPPMPTALGTGQPAGFYAPSQPVSMDRNLGSANTDGEFIEILISEPQKVGDGMGSYMAYKMTTRTNINFFKKQCWSVTRRFSDYLGLHAKLVEKHLHAGRIIPPAPEKDALNTTKLRLSSGETVDGAAEFLERRRASLQRYMQRTAALPHLRTDPDFREFVELDSDLPRATQTSAMSSAGVLRLFNRVGETVNKITFKMEESDQWFEERAQQVEALEAELRRLHGALEGLAGGRRELAAGSSALSKAAAVLSSVEEHSALSRALHQLAEATDRTHTVYHAQADADFYILCETTRDYINLIGAVKEVFHERVKVFQAWQYSQTMLAKKRDAKAKLELTARQEKVALAQQEVQEWEGKVERNQEHFERISGAIKKELEQFDVVRVQDFKSMLIRYLEAMVTSQQQVIKVWESFLPEAKAIS